MVNAWWIILVGVLAGMFAGYCLIAPILLCCVGFGCGGVTKGKNARPSRLRMTLSPTRIS